MMHYFCKGECGGVSDTPGNCNAEMCSRFDKPLTECGCLDGKHGMPEKDAPEKSSEKNDPKMKNE